MSSEARTEQTDFDSCYPRFGQSKLVLVHVIRGSDGANWFWCMSSEARTKQTDFDSCYPRLGQKKRAWVCSVDRVDSLNWFKFASSPGSTILTIAALSQ